MMANDRIRIELLPILFASILFAGACAQQKASTSSPESIARHRTETGQASWYGKAHHGQRTANGERFDMNALTAAHRTLPFGTIVRVTKLQGGRSVNVGSTIAARSAAIGSSICPTRRPGSSGSSHAAPLGLRSRWSIGAAPGSMTRA